MNFHGEVAIIFTDKGNRAKFYKDRQQIIVPASGILFLKQKPFFGQIDYRYYEKTFNGFKEIKRFISPAKNGHDSVHIFFEETVSGLLKGKNGKSIYYDGFKFFVGKRLDSLANIERFYFSQHLDSVIINHL